MSARRDRFLHIVETLGRHGLGFTLGHLGLDHLHLPGRPAPQLPGAAGVPLPARVRLALEDLGAVYIKFGQIVSTRADVLPPEYAAELAKLQDASPPVPAAQIRAVITDELGPRAARLLASLRDVPLATGSIGQVHESAAGPADEPGGRADVVVKVRRPGVVAQVNEDLEIMAELAKRAEQASAAVAGFHVAALVDEFSQTMRAELDYMQEARNAEQFAENFAGDGRVHIPRVFWDTTTSRVLTLERVRGIKINDVAGPAARRGSTPANSPSRPATSCSRWCSRTDFSTPTPTRGTSSWNPTGGWASSTSAWWARSATRHAGTWSGCCWPSSNRTPGGSPPPRSQLCGATQATDFSGLQAALGRLVDRYAGLPLAQVPIVPVLAELAGLLRAHRLRLPREMALLVKMLVMADGLGKQLDPGFELTAQLAPFTRRILLGSLSPDALASRLKKLGWEALRFGTEAPELARRLLDVLETGGLDIHFRADELDRLMDKAERTGNRIVAGLITAALIGAVGELVSGQPDRWRSWPKALFTAGLGGVGALGGYLAVTSRHRRRG